MELIKQFKKSEIVGSIFIYLILLLNVFVFKDSPIAFVSAFFGITYTILAGKGTPICYIFGVMGSSFYGYLAFHNALWGNLILYMGYYVPMQILGYFRWHKHLKSDKYEIEKISLNKKEMLILMLLSIFACIITSYILILTKDKSPFVDAITSVLSIAGMYLTVKRAIEQWWFWMIVNGLSAFMWIRIALEGEKVYSTVIMWSVYFVLAIYFYTTWRRELKVNRVL